MLLRMSTPALGSELKYVLNHYYFLNYLWPISNNPFLLSKRKNLNSKAFMSIIIRQLTIVCM
jgi:hypothetical protein